MKQNSSRKQLLQNNDKNGSQHKDFNKNHETPNTDPPQATIALHHLKVNSVRFKYLYGHIKPRDDTHEATHLIDTQEQNIEDADVKQE